MAELGRRLGVDGETIAKWEFGSSPRRRRHRDAIYRVLGYCPVDVTTRSYAAEIRGWRASTGLSQPKAASALGVSLSTLRRMEGGAVPAPAVLPQLLAALEKATLPAE